MRKIRLLIVATVLAAGSVVALGSPAHAGCPDPDNPCTPPTYDPLGDLYCKVLKKC